MGIVEEVLDLGCLLGASFDHVQRSTDEAADKLSKEGVSYQSLIIIHVPP